MRIISTLLFLFFSISLNAQPGCDIFPREKKLIGKSPCINVKTQAKDTTRIIIRCGGTILPDKPLLVVNGVLSRLDSLSEINPNDIESVNILKESVGSALFGLHGACGVICVTTKPVKLFIKNRWGPLARATVIVEGTSIGVVADDSGVVVMNRFSDMVGRNLNISFVGHNLKQVKFSGKTDTVYLEPSPFCGSTAVVVSSSHSIRCKCYNCYLKRVRPSSFTTLKSTASNSFNVYPSPAQKGQIITVEIYSQEACEGNLKLVSLDGKTLYQTPCRLTKGTNRLQVNTDTRWPVGIYFMQFTDELHHRVVQQKIILQ